MRKLFYVTSIAITSCLIAIGCKKSSNPGSMSASINGASFSGSNCTATKGDVSTTLIIKSTVPKSDIVLVIVNYAGVGTYPLTDTGTLSLDNTGNVDSNTVLYATSGSGTVTITGTSPNITGTFSFVAALTPLFYKGDTLHVTGGTFSATQ